MVTRNCRRRRPGRADSGTVHGEKGLETTVFDTYNTWLHKAHLFNYPGTGSIDGTVYLETLRDQCVDFGVEREQGVEVTGVEADDGGFTVSHDNGETATDYVMLATGANRDLAEELGCDFDGDIVDVDVTIETSVADAYATDAMGCAEGWQAIISAGDGAAAALNILPKQKGENFHNFNVPADAEELFSGMNES